MYRTEPISKITRLKKLKAKEGRYSMYNYINCIISYRKVKPWEREKARKWFNWYVFPPRATYTRSQRILTEAGCPILKMYWQPIGFDHIITSTGPVEVLSEELRGYPLMRMASLYFHLQGTDRFEEYNPTADQWRCLHRFCRLTS